MAADISEAVLTEALKPYFRDTEKQEIAEAVLRTATSFYRATGHVLRGITLGAKDWKQLRADLSAHCKHPYPTNDDGAMTIYVPGGSCRVSRA